MEIGGFEGRKLKKGDEIELKHHYSQRHLKLFENLSDKRTTDWGIDGYALSFNYVSDVFHVIKIRERKILKEATRRFTTAEYSVSSKTNRVGMVLDGPQIKAYYDDMPAHQSVKEEPFKLREMAHRLYY